jgi:hypothetical protein
MKNRILVLFALSLFFSACSKDKDDSGNTNPPAEDTFINTNTGSTWLYHEDNTTNGTSGNSDYILTATDRDSTIEGRSYHVYTNSMTDNEYMTISGHEYYKYESIPGTSDLGGIAAERLYLKDNLKQGDTWKQDFSFQPSGSPIPLSFSLNNKIAEKGISKTVNGVAYNNVIHVSTTLTSSLIPSQNLTSTIDMYYAPDYGLIESSIIIKLDYMGFSEDVNISTQLKSAQLK